jgi:choline-sulfatase
LTLRRQYCAAIQAIDDQVGDILAAAEARGDDRETYIFFSADHGEMMGDHSLPIKHVAYQPSWRIPLIVSGPGLPEGKVSEALVELMDVGETICDLAGSPRPIHVDAHSLLPHLRGECDDHRDHVVTIERPFEAIRDKKWKFIQTHNDLSELYDMEDDPLELNNLIDDQPEKAQELAKLMKESFSEGKYRKG